MTGVTLMIVIALLVSTFTILLYYFDKNVLSQKYSHKTLQIVYGLVFGIIAIAGTEFGVSVHGALMNIRDAAPLCAAFFFGPEAGVIAGILGSVERWFSVYWGAGEFTRLACTLGTLFAGFLGAFVKKFLLDKRIPGPFYAFAIGGVAEVFHMLMVYLTRGDQAIQAHAVIQVCAPVMIPLVAISVAVPALVIAKISNETTISWQKSERGIAQNIALGLLLSVTLAFVLTNWFELSLQNKLAIKNADEALTQAVQDVRSDLLMSDIESNEDLLAFLNRELTHRHIGTVGFIVAVDKKGDVVANTSKEVDADNFKKELKYIRTQDELTITKIIDESGNSTLDYYTSYIKYGDYYIVGVYPSSEADLNKSMSVTLTALLEVVILAVVFLMMYLLVRVVVIKELNIINKDLAAITQGELDTTVNVRSSTEFASLSNDINTTVDTLKQYIADAAAKVDEELKVAKNIQRSALPNIFPDDNRFELYASMNAAKDVGGDFYDFYPVGEDKYAFLIADVSGKGIPAAMFMMSAKSVIKSIVETGATPGVAFTKANEKLCVDNDAEMFVTAWLGIMDLNTGHVVYANAGHNPPVLKNEDGNFEYLKCRPGFVLAGMEGIQYKDFEFDMTDGMSLLLYTDGVTEATNVNNELFGEDRLVAALVESGVMNMRYTCKHIKSRVDEFAGEAPQFDDITMLGIKRKNDQDRKSSLVLVADQESADKVRTFFDMFIEDNEIPIKASTKIMVMVDEIYSNILNYSGASKSKVTARYEDGKVLMSFQDNGIYYNPLKKEDPDITLSAEERAIGGLGIFMVKQMAEDVKYTRIAGKNILDVVLDV